MASLPTVPSDEESESKDQPQYKRPEFIILDDSNDFIHGGHPENQTSNKTQGENLKFDPASTHLPYSLRMCCLFGFVFCLVFSMALTFWTFLVLCGAALLLFQNQTLNQTFFTFWRLCRNAFMALFGFTVGLFSPTLGLGLLVLYFSLKGEPVDNEFWRKILRRTFNQP